MLPPRKLHLLLIMLLICGADATCPTDSNPLTLHPSEVIAEYQAEVLVNCSSSHEGGMHWSNGTIEEGSFISWKGLLSDWDLTLECKIKTNDSEECSKELEFTVYKNPDMVVLFPINHVNHTVAGTQYSLQCDVLEAAPVQNLTVTWYRDNETIRTETFPNTAKTPVSESSLLVINASRGDNGAVFRCEAQLDFGPHGPKLPSFSQTHVLSVHYAPELNNNTYETTNVFVSKGDDVTLSCDAEGNPPPHYRWTLDGGNMTENTYNINVTQVDVNATYTCTASNDLGRITKHISIHVTKNFMVFTEPEPPTVCPLTLTPAELVVRFGDRASVNCSTSATDALGMGWEAPSGGTGFERRTSVAWTVEELQDWSIKPKCYITLRSNAHQCTATQTVKLYKTPDAVSVSALTHGPMVEGVPYRLRCDITNVAPVQDLRVIWSIGERNLSVHVFNYSTRTPVNESTVLNVTLTRDHNGAPIRCNAELHLGPNGPEAIPVISSEPFTAVVHYKPMIDCPSQFTGVEHDFRLEMVPCKTDGNPPPTVKWLHMGKPINGSEPLSRAQSGKHTVHVSNDISSTSKDVSITIQYGPSFVCDDRYEVRENGKVLMECIPEGIPAPNITWLKNGEVVVSPQRWTKRNGGKYTLRATNQHGTAEHTLYLDVLFAPEFKEGNYIQEVTPGQNVTFACSAEGNPVPEIHWNFTGVRNALETTGGRQKNVSVTGATSTNAGVYVCSATNKVGSVSRSVTLRMRGGPHRRRLSVIWWLLILCFLTLLLIVMVSLCRRRRRHGQYSFIPADREGSTIPLTTMSGGDKA